jgi:hypothetical protein
VGFLAENARIGVPQLAKAPSANPGSERRYRSCATSTHDHGFAPPRRFEICHRLLAALSIAAIMRALRRAGGNRPEPRLDRAAAEKRGRAEGRSLANYLEQLIKREIERQEADTKGR